MVECSFKDGQVLIGELAGYGGRQITVKVYSDEPSQTVSFDDLACLTTWLE
jgi:hypothetical protein